MAKSDIRLRIAAATRDPSLQEAIDRRDVQAAARLRAVEAAGTTVDADEDQWRKLKKKVRELLLFSEQGWPAFTNEHNGHVRLGYLDPALIETVVMDPDNAEQPIGIVTVKDGKGRARRYQVIVNGVGEDVFSPRTQDVRAALKIRKDTYAEIEAQLRAADRTINCGCESLPYMEHWGVSTPGAKPYSPQERMMNRRKVTTQPGMPADLPAQSEESRIATKRR